MQILAQISLAHTLKEEYSLAPQLLLYVYKAYKHAGHRHNEHFTAYSLRARTPNVSFNIFLNIFLIDQLHANNISVLWHSYKLFTFFLPIMLTAKEGDLRLSGYRKVTLGSTRSLPCWPVGYSLQHTHGHSCWPRCMSSAWLSDRCDHVAFLIP